MCHFPSRATQEALEAASRMYFSRPHTWMRGVANHHDAFKGKFEALCYVPPDRGKRRLVAGSSALVTITCFSGTCLFAPFGHRPNEQMLSSQRHPLMTRTSRTMACMDRSAGHYLALRGLMTLFQSHSSSQIHCSLVTQRQVLPRVLENG